MTTPNTVLKVVFCVQLVLTTWAAQCDALFSPAYMYINAFAMLFGVYAIVNTESSEAVFMVSKLTCAIAQAPVPLVFVFCMHNSTSVATSV